MIKSVFYPWFVQRGIRHADRRAPEARNIKIFGADTETCHGRPVSVQIAGPEDSHFCYTEPERVFLDFWTYLKPQLRPKGVNICYFHNLNFDLRVLFCGSHSIMYEQFNDIKFEIGPVKIRMLFGKVNKADLREGPYHLTILDSKAFTLASLKRSLEMFKIGTEKLESPPGLGEVRYDLLPEGDPLRVIFEDYAKRDADAERQLGLKIQEFHRAYDVGPSMTLPSYAAKVFRRHFLKADEEIPFPPVDIVKASEKSYHGGKNGYYLKSHAVLEDIYETDISSAYPHAMLELPPMTKGQFFKTNEFRPGMAGIYCISGETFQYGLNAQFPLVFDHAFKPVKGRFDKLWHTGYEVTEMLTVPHNVRLDELWGYVWMPAEGAENPFKRYVEHFYGKKESTPKSDPYYHFYKIAMNALYGKLCSTIEVKSIAQDDELKKLREMGYDVPDWLRIDERYDPVLGRDVCIQKSWRAGALYNPFWASQITGHTRAAIYRLECQSHAFHTATDSVKGPVDLGATKGLGGRKVECYGRCYVFRNKLYLHFSKDYKFCGHKPDALPFHYPEKDIFGNPIPFAGDPMVTHDGQHLCKVAMHGYKGPLWWLFHHKEMLMQTGILKYHYVHVIGLREGMRRRKPVADFQVYEETLDLNKAVDAPMNMLEYIVHRGGISLEREGSTYRGELLRLTMKEGGPRGMVNKTKGMSLDSMRESCAEAGYLEMDSDVNQFLDLIDSCMAGRRVYSRYDIAPDEWQENYREQEERNG